MKYQKYPAQTIKVAGDLRRAPATFENPELVSYRRYRVNGTNAIPDPQGGALQRQNFTL